MVSTLDVSHNPKEVCKLTKALYCLNEAHRAWFKRFSIVVTSFDFYFNAHDSTHFVKSTSIDHILLSLYVDGMIIIGNYANGIALLKTELAQYFDMKDLDPLRYFLGIDLHVLLRVIFFLNLNT